MQPILINCENFTWLYIPQEGCADRQMVKLKLNPIRDALEGKRIAVVDDSIVRGTTKTTTAPLYRT